MTIWAAILVLGVTAIWVAFGAAMTYLVARAPHADGAPQRARIRDR